ncbi:MAG: methyltransferase domain-containing protein [Parvibaculum sp.]
MLNRRKLQLYFRKRRNAALDRVIRDLHARKGGTLKVLDVGGSPFFWETVPARALCEITLFNQDEALESRDFRISEMNAAYRFQTGNGCDMPEIADASVDLVVCNSVIEHTVLWANMQAMARELVRVGKHGWVQVPAHEFPVEPHYMLPIVHWLSVPNRIGLLRLLRRGTFGGKSASEMRTLIEKVNLLTGREMKALFPGKSCFRERFLLFTKSHIVSW